MQKYATTTSSNAIHRMQIKYKEICDEIGHCNIQNHDYNDVTSMGMRIGRKKEYLYVEVVVREGNAVNKFHYRIISFIEVNTIHSYYIF